MIYPYILPPSKEEIVDQIANWLARLFRVKVTITIDNGVGERHTIEVAHPDKPETL